MAYRRKVKVVRVRALHARCIANGRDDRAYFRDRVRAHVRECAHRLHVYARACPRVCANGNGHDHAHDERVRRPSTPPC